MENEESFVLPCKIPKPVPAGEHTGEIKRLQTAERGQPAYKYFDVYVSIDDVPETELRYSCPYKLTPNSKLGKLVSQFTDLKEQDYNLEELLLNKKIKFTTIHVAKGEKKFAEISGETIQAIPNEA